MKNNCIECGKDCTGKRCKICHIKFSGKSFTFDKWHFDTQTALDNAIKTNLKFMPYNVEIDDDFLLAVINNLHPEVIKRNFKCLKLKILNWEGQTGQWEFCRDRFRGGIFIIGYFEPIKEWHGVTVYPHKRNHNHVREKLINTLRQKWSEHTKKRNISIRCEECNNENPQLHHDNISFKEIAEKSMTFFSEKELKEGIGDDWWLHENEADAIPNNHPAVEEMIRLHKDVKYKWLCEICHMKQHYLNNRGMENGD